MLLTQCDMSTGRYVCFANEGANISSRKRPFCIKSPYQVRGEIKNRPVNMGRFYLNNKGDYSFVGSWGVFARFKCRYKDTVLLKPHAAHTSWTE